MSWGRRPGFRKPPLDPGSRWRPRARSAPRTRLPGVPAALRSARPPRLGRPPRALAASPHPAPAFPAAARGLAEGQPPAGGFASAEREMGVRDRAERRRSLGKERLGAVGLGAGGWTPFPRRPRAPPEAPCAYKEGGAARFPWGCGAGDGRCGVPGCFGLESCWLRRRAATEAGLGDPCGLLWFGGEEELEWGVQGARALGPLPPCFALSLATPPLASAFPCREWDAVVCALPSAGVACLYRHESSSEVAGSKRSPSP